MIYLIYIVLPIAVIFLFYSPWSLPRIHIKREKLDELLNEFRRKK